MFCAPVKGRHRRAGPHRFAELARRIFAQILHHFDLIFNVAKTAPTSARPRKNGCAPPQPTLKHLKFRRIYQPPFDYAKLSIAFPRGEFSKIKLIFNQNSFFVLNVKLLLLVVFEDFFESFSKLRFQPTSKQLLINNFEVNFKVNFSICSPIPF